LDVSTGQSAPLVENHDDNAVTTALRAIKEAKPVQ
jgi:hypothetical protein